MNQELPDVQVVFRKCRDTRDQVDSICWIAGSSKKIPTSASWTMLKPLTVWISTNYGKFLKRWKYQTTLPVCRETSMQVKKQQLEADVEQWTDSNLGKQNIKVVCCHPAYLTSMQTSSWEMPAWMTQS